SRARGREPGGCTLRPEPARGDLHGARRERRRGQPRRRRVPDRLRPQRHTASSGARRREAVERVMAQKDFYAVLGVPSGATADEIKKQYRRLAKQYHPDTNTGDAKAAERFKEISEAYTVLGDAEKRKQYDEMRRLGAFDPFASRGPRP